jgi:hypothetical protein
VIRKKVIGTIKGILQYGKDKNYNEVFQEVIEAANNLQ